MWRLAGFLRWRPAQHLLLGIVLLLKWAVWFPVMVIRHGFSEALNAANERHARALSCRGRADPSTFSVSLVDLLQQPDQAHEASASNTSPPVTTAQGMTRSHEKADTHR
jgi:hypothetical protein